MKDQPNAWIFMDELFNEFYLMGGGLTNLNEFYFYGTIVYCLSYAVLVTLQLTDRTSRMPWHWCSRDILDVIAFTKHFTNIFLLSKLHDEMSAKYLLVAACNSHDFTVRCYVKLGCYAVEFRLLVTLSF